jgi:hypothetical protein
MAEAGVDTSRKIARKTADSLLCTLPVMFAFVIVG